MSYAQPENMTGLHDLFTYTNTVTSNIFGIGTLITLYIIIFTYLKSKGEEATDCFVVAGFITSLTATFFFFITLITGLHLFTFYLIYVLSIVWTYNAKS